MFRKCVDGLLPGHGWFKLYRQELTFCVWPRAHRFAGAFNHVLTKCLAMSLNETKIDIPIISKFRTESEEGYIWW